MKTLNILCRRSKGDSSSRQLSTSSPLRCCGSWMGSMLI